jgi:CHAT domain-containing protein
MLKAGEKLDSWQDLLARAEADIALGNAPGAYEKATAGIAAFERSVALLVRDPDRVDACDQPDVAALYVIAARALLAESAAVDSERAALALETVDRVRSLAAPQAVTSVADAATLGRWRRAAAEYSAISSSLLARLEGASPTEADAGYEQLAAADAALAGAEAALELADPGFLVRRAASVDPEPVSGIRFRLPHDTVMLAYVLVGDDLLGFAVTREAVRAQHATVDGRGLIDGVRRFHSGCAQGRAPETDLDDLLLGPFAEELRVHRRVIVVPFGPLAALPFHALPFDDLPLGLGRVVSYQHRLAYPGDADAPVSHERPLVVGDPAFDTTLRSPLRRLPGARLEALHVASVLGLGSDHLLIDGAATEAAVVRAADTCDLLHISSHGHLDELSPFATALVLAAADELTVADLAGSTLPTGLAVLTGCDTGRGNATLGGDVIGLTRALLRSGVRRTIVSLWPVDDAVAPVLIQALYKRIRAGDAPAVALALAQQELAAMSADQLRAAYVALGGGEEAASLGRSASLRRGGAGDLGLDAELLDNEELPEPLGGDAERYWAPFVLVT